MPAERTPATSRRFSLVRWFVTGVLAIALLDAIYLMAIWPDWQALEHGPIPKSAYIDQYEAKAADDGELPRLRWRPVPLSAIAPSLRRAVVVAEDARFWRHGGFDLGAIRDAVEYNWEQGRFAYGASTLSQQTARNLLLSPARNPLRKWHEVVFTLALEHHLAKERILELYLNVAEFGVGLYGADAAARAYFGVPASRLSEAQAIALAACLPSPQLHNPATATPAFERRRQKIARHLAASR